ncbi:TPA: hypothetical protein ACIVDR_004122 [Salmonella enterica subsp. enterica serovar Wangata]|uniref:MrpH family fimbial adhesin n=1 Tax=Escherichia TaxID=561 RepID=UPI001774794B|nr:hypothetical protein [Escherichia coli]HBD1225238.1 hypothetical protein [Escherichia coli]HDO3170792.1 hypothetical protein [Salmonella enterica subsp. enterica serovar Typhimurium]
MRFLFLSLSVLMCSFAHANNRYCNILWLNDYKPYVQPFRLNVDGNAILSTPVNINVGGTSTAIKSVSAMSGLGGRPISGHVRYWFQFPTDWQISHEGIRYRISSALDDADIQVPGVRTVVTPKMELTWDSLYGCAAQGQKYTFINNTEGPFQLEIDRATAFPGRYNIQLPIKSGYEENKGNYQGESENGWKGYAEAMAAFPTIDSSGMDIEIRSSCSISTRYIDINYGTINISNALDGVKKGVGVNIACSAPAQVKLELTGSDFVDGIKNKVNCGGGSCMLSFSSGNADETLIFYREGMQTVNIESLFKANNIIPGEFYGNAVLKMNVL